MDEVVAEAQYRLEPVALSAGVARRIVRQVLVDGDRRQWLDAAELAVSEIVTNAVLHAHTQVEICARLTPTALRVEVRDFSPLMPEAYLWGEDATTGRGLALVDAVSAEHGVEPLGAAGKIVWCCIRDAGTPRSSPGELLSDRWADEATEHPAASSVVLPDFPVELWLAAREHHDAILRDLTLYRANHEEVQVSAEQHAQADRARNTISASLDRAIAVGEQPTVVDLSVPVPADAVGAFAVLQDVLDEADRLAADGVLMVRPALPEIVALRDWACEQVIARVHGAPATRWAGAAREEFADRALHTHRPAWDVESVASSSEPLIAADDGNRIVAVSRVLAEQLGWDAAELTGRRLVTIVPPRLREAHVAGFTHHLATGRRRLIGRRVEVPVLHHDGTEAPAYLRVDAHDADDGRTVFIGRIDVR